MAPPASTGRTAGRGPGRPPRLSRERILEAALALLEREPAAPLTVARIAGEVDSAPGALYRHFTRLDELQDDVLARVLGGIEGELRAGAPWPTRVRAWMTAVRDRLHRYPALLPLLGRHGRTSPAWLEAVSGLIGILEKVPLSGATLAHAHLWIAETTVGIAMLEASLSVPDQIANARASLAHVPAASRGRVARVLPHLARLDGDAFFAFAAGRAVDAVVALAKRR